MTERPSRWRDRLLPWWAVGYPRAWLRDDLSAGLVLTVMLVPQAMAYASLAGMPPITGLYAAVVALLAYAWIGSSSHVSFGPFALVALLSAAAVEPLAAGEPARFVLLSGALALMVGTLHLSLALLRAEAIAALISRPVVVGFTSAIGIVIALSQVRDLTGVEVARSARFLDAVTGTARAIPDPHLPTLLVGTASLAVLLVGRYLAPKFPSALVVVIGGIAAAQLLDLDLVGVALVDDIPSGLPQPTIPLVTLTDLGDLVPAAVVLALVCLAGNMSMAKAIASRTRERIDARRELFASGTANLASGLVGGFPVAASFTRTMVAYDAGARSQLAGVVAAGSLVTVLIALTPVLEPLPRAVLAAIVIVAVVGLVDVRAVRSTFRVDRTDGVVLVVTFLATLTFGVELGLLTGVGVNLAVHVVRGMRPAMVELGRVPGTDLYRNVERYPTVTDPSGVVLRLEGPLDFLSVQTVTDRLRRLAADRPELTWLVLDASGVTGLDASGVHALHETQEHLVEAGVSLHLCSLRGPQRDVVERAGLWEALIGGTCHPTVAGALAAAGVPPDAPLRQPGPDEGCPDGLW